MQLIDQSMYICRRKGCHHITPKIMHFTIFSSIVILVLINLVGGISFEQDVSLNLEQKKLLDQFKARVIDRLPHDYMKREIYLIKWLRSNNYNLDRAEDALYRNLRWRKEQKMDTIHSEDWVRLRLPGLWKKLKSTTLASKYSTEKNKSDMWDNDYRYYIDGRDKMGRPFLFLELKHFDARKLIVQGKGERMLRYFSKAWDEGCNLIQELGAKYGNMTRGNVVFDLDGFNAVQHVCIQCIPYMIRNVVDFVQHFPECLDKMIYVKSPQIMEQVLTLTKPLLPAEYGNSTFVYGTNKEVWMAGLREDFDLDQLPPGLGGTKLYKGMEYR